MLRHAVEGAGRAVEPALLRKMDGDVANRDRGRIGIGVVDRRAGCGHDEKRSCSGHRARAELRYNSKHLNYFLKLSICGLVQLAAIALQEQVAFMRITSSISIGSDCLIDKRKIVSAVE